MYHRIAKRGLLQERKILKCLNCKRSYYFATKICGYVLIGCVYDVVFLKNAFFQDSLNHRLSHIHKYPCFLCIICTFAVSNILTLKVYFTWDIKKTKSH